MGGSVCLGLGGTRVGSGVALVWSSLVKFFAEPDPLWTEFAALMDRIIVYSVRDLLSALTSTVSPDAEKTSLDAQSLDMKFHSDEEMQQLAAAQSKASRTMEAPIPECKKLCSYTRIHCSRMLNQGVTFFGRKAWRSHCQR